MLVDSTITRSMSPFTCGASVRGGGGRAQETLVSYLAQGGQRLFALTH